MIAGYVIAALIIGYVLGGVTIGGIIFLWLTRTMRHN